MNRITYILILLIFTSCFKSSEITTDTVQLGKLNVRLLQNEKGASVVLGSKDYVLEGELKLMGPCYFLRKNGAIVSHTYRDVKVDQIIILVGNVADDQMKDKFGVDRNNICGTQIQGLLVKGKKVILSKKVLSGNVTCKDLGLDEKNFWHLAH